MDSPASSPLDGVVSKPEVVLEDFQRLDIRIGRVQAAEEVPGSAKLLKLRVDVGGGERQLVAGIRAHYAPADLVGKRVVVLANLKAARIFGLESQGMLLAAEGEGRIGVLTVEREVPVGSSIR